jgi:hypothetical protein
MAVAIVHCISIKSQTFCTPECFIVNVQIETTRWDCRIVEQNLRTPDTLQDIVAKHQPVSDRS